MSENLKARVFISCGQQKGTEEEKIAEEIKERLEDLGFKPYVAITDQTTKGFKENIFQNLNKSEYFIFIDFKREKLNWEKFCFERKKTRRYRGSLFSNQELALASYFCKEIMAFQEEGIKEREMEF